MDYRAIVAATRSLALEAGAAIMEVHGDAELTVRSKADTSPVTEADERADALIREGLARAFPAIPVVTEEDAASHDVQAEAFFLVDPLDGTREFIGRAGDFTVNIALVVSGIPVCGVVFAPARGRLFYTDGAGGAVEEVPPGSPESTGELRRLRVADPDPEGVVVVASKSHRTATTDDYIARYRVKSFAPAGSSLKFCLVAAGEADLYPRLGPTMEWDTAAGHAIVAAAGGAVVRADDLAPLRYGKPGWRNPAFIAHAPGVALLPVC
jgi:3'(2'), 5'-bisphosphate nucleotidase